jgi:2-oxoglutarate dehydrogenase complex dehydrogenase (E1) component-like enzyme
MEEGTSFQPVLDTDPNHSASRVILCSGKHYYTLHDHFTKTSALSDVSLIRVEELSPFPRSQLKMILSKYTNVDKVVWAQEEPENQGSWSYVQPRLDEVLRDLGMGGNKGLYAGRRTCATVATAVGAWHKREIDEIARLSLEV